MGEVNCEMCINVRRKWVSAMCKDDKWGGYLSLRPFGAPPSSEGGMNGKTMVGLKSGASGMPPPTTTPHPSCFASHLLLEEKAWGVRIATASEETNSTPLPLAGKLRIRKFLLPFHFKADALK